MKEHQSVAKTTSIVVLLESDFVKLLTLCTEHIIDIKIMCIGREKMRERRGGRGGGEEYRKGGWRGEVR